VRTKALHLKPPSSKNPMPKDMTLAKAFSVALVDNHVGTSETGVNFKKGIGQVLHYVYSCPGYKGPSRLLSISVTS
jgi:hypothetical protein